MKNIKYIASLIILITCSVSVSLAQVGLDKIAQSTMNFQLVSISPRASAMGEAFYAMSEGAESIFFNPAGIVESERTFDIKFYSTQWIADINYMAAAFSYKSELYGSVGLHILSVDYGTIHSTRLLYPGEEDLYPRGYKDLGNAENVGAYSLGLTYGKAISDKFFAGGSIRFVGQNLGQNEMSAGSMEDNNASKLVFDAGVKYYTGIKSFRFGMAIRNFSSNIKREEVDEQLPLTFSMGAAIDLLDMIPMETDQVLTLAVDFLHSNNFSERMNMGLEYEFWDMIALRGGYQTNRDVASWSASVGLNASVAENDVAFNYSYSNIDIFDAVNRFSLGVSF